MWIFLTALLLLMPVAMVIMGMKLLRAKPRKERYYRTERALRNEATERYAHKICGRFYLWIGKRLLLITLLFGIILLRLNSDLFEPFCGVILLIEISSLLLAVPLTEGALKNKFDNA